MSALNWQDSNISIKEIIHSWTISFLINGKRGRYHKLIEVIEDQITSIWLNKNILPWKEIVKETKSAKRSFQLLKTPQTWIKLVVHASIKQSCSKSKLC
jgi:hypothetical protein